MTETIDKTSAKQKRLKGKCVKATKFFFTRMGYKVLETGYTTPDGEMDVIALDEDGCNLVFVTVGFACVGEGSFDFPPEDVSKAARGRAERIAVRYLCESDLEPDFVFRFDAVSVLVMGEDCASIRHHINCFAA